MGFSAVLSDWRPLGPSVVRSPCRRLTNESLLVTAVFGIVKLIAAIGCALFLVDLIGRKRALLIGISLQAIAMIYVAAFLTADPQLGGQEKYTISLSELGPPGTLSQ